MNKKILIITTHFPPYGGGGVYRVFKFVKYLPGSGWQPYVVTGDFGKNVPFYDKTLLKELPDSVEIFRIKSLKQKLSGKTDNGTPVNHADGGNNRKSSVRGLYSLANAILGKILIPDKLLLWCFESYGRCKKIIRDEKIDTVLTSSPPESVHLLGLWLKRKFKNLKWIADFRDLWTVENVELPEYKFRRCRKLEEKILKTADLSLVVGDEIREATLKAFGSDYEKKIVTITNGFDPEDFEGAEAEHGKDGKFTLSFVGSMLRNTKNHRLLEALKLIAEEDSIGNDIRVRFIGIFDSSFKEKVLSYSLENMIEFREFCPHKEAVGYMLNSDGLLLTLGNNKTHALAYTLKLFEYLYTQKPVLAVVPEGVIADMVRKYRIGYVAGPDSKEDIASGIKMLYDDYKEGKKNTGISDIQLNKFNRINLTKQLVAYMEKLH